MRAGLAALALLFLGGTFAAGQPFGGVTQAPELTIRPDADEQYRPLLRINGLLDDASLEEAARSGLPLRVRVRVELWRDGWIDRLVDSQSWTSVLLYEPLGREFILRQNPDASPAARFDTYSAARAAIERDYRLTLRPQRPGRYYYTASLVLETLSLSDLEELERWLQGQLQPAVSGERSLPGAVGQGAKRLMIRLLGLPTRRLDAKSERFQTAD